MKMLLKAGLALAAITGIVEAKEQWPNGSRLVISISMQFETGGQPEGAESPFSGNTLPKGQPDLPAESWYRYGANEGIPRIYAQR